MNLKINHLKKLKFSSDSVMGTSAHITKFSSDYSLGTL